MNIDNLTIGQAREIAAQFGGQTTATSSNAPHAPQYVVVCTDKRGVVFGSTTDISARPIRLSNARMCLYWSADVGGVFGLAEKGPSPGCKISACLPHIVLEGITAIMSMDPAAVAAWERAPVQGR